MLYYLKNGLRGVSCEMLDLIKELRYDIFLVYSGLILIIGISWVYVVLNPDMIDVLKKTTNSQYFMVIWTVVSWFGVYIFLKGISEFHESYAKDKEMQELERGVRAVELKSILDKHHLKYTAS